MNPLKPRSHLHTEQPHEAEHKIYWKNKRYKQNSESQSYHFI